jgi:hypothetical protein
MPNPADQSPFVPAEAGIQALPQILGCRVRGNEPGMYPRQALTL